VRTSRARAKIRQQLRQEEQVTSQKLGREILERELRRRRLGKVTDETLNTAARALSLTDSVHLLAAIGQGEIQTLNVVKQLFPSVDESAEVGKPSVIERLVDKVRGTENDRGVKIQGVDGVMVRYAQCCQPVPGDEVVGYVTRGRGVSIHRADCPNLLPLAHEPERRLEIDWQEKFGERFIVRLALEGTDRRGLYADVASAVSSTGTDIRQMELKAVDGRAVGAMMVEVENLQHLQQIVKAVRRVKGISEIARRERISTED
jgi:GTP pyrophosphokinase